MVAFRFGKMSKKLGAPPGTVQYVGEKPDTPVTIQVIDFDRDEYRELNNANPEDCEPFLHTDTITWINVIGIHDADIINRLGARFGLHPLHMEDVANPSQRPKLEEDKSFVFCATKMLQVETDGYSPNGEHVSLFFGKGWVLTFQEFEGDVFDHVRNRIKRTVPRVRFLSADYLAYALLDAIVDHYFVVLESLAERVEDLESDVVGKPDPGQLELIYSLKRDVMFCRRSVWPMREIAAAFERSESALIQDFTRPYLKDLYDHTMQSIDMVETFRDTVAGLLDVHLTSVSNRMNEVMKVLTIIATIFIPLGFLAGVYGMNFDREAGGWNMPELGFAFGYPMFWAVALLIAGSLVWFFRRRGWL